MLVSIKQTEAAYYHQERGKWLRHSDCSSDKGHHENVIKLRWFLWTQHSKVLARRCCETVSLRMLAGSN